MITYNHIDFTIILNISIRSIIVVALTLEQLEAYLEYQKIHLYINNNLIKRVLQICTA